MIKKDSKIAIIADSHDNIPNIKKMLRFINKEGIKTIIHCGDLCAPAILSQVIVPNFSGQIHLVHSNVGDPEKLAEMAREMSGVEVYGGQGEIVIGYKKIGFTHFPKTAKEMAQTGKYDIVFYGHTHRPWEESYKLKAKSCKLVNPGTLAGIFYKATFAILNTKTEKLELKILELIK